MSTFFKLYEKPAVTFMNVYNSKWPFHCEFLTILIGWLRTCN